jgi:hypothetical protein
MKSGHAIQTLPNKHRMQNQRKMKAKQKKLSDVIPSGKSSIEIVILFRPVVAERSFE